MDSFYVTLPSNVSSKKHFQNSIGNYTTKLPHTLYLIGDWEVALTDISYTKSWYNVKEDVSGVLFSTEEIRKFKKIHYPFKTSIKAGFYKTIEDLVLKLNKELELAYLNEKAESEVNEVTYNYVFKSPASLKYDDKTNTVSVVPMRIKINDDIRVFFPTFGELDYILGIYELNKKLSSFWYKKVNNQSKIIRGGTFTEDDGDIYISYNRDHVVNNQFDSLESIVQTDITAGHHSLYVYCDAAERSIVGDSFTSLLRVVEIPENAEYGAQVNINYVNPHFYKVDKKSFDTIEIDVKDDVNETIPFKRGRTIVTLLFRRKTAPSKLI